MRLILEGARRRWLIDFTREDKSCGHAEPGESGGPLDAMVERAHPDDVPERAELDSRRGAGHPPNPMRPAVVVIVRRDGVARSVCRICAEESN